VIMSITYRAVKSRFWGLLGGSLLMASWLGLAASVAFMVWFMIFYFVALASVVLTKLSNWLAVTMGVLGGTVATVVALTLFFFVAGRGSDVSPEGTFVGGGAVSGLGWYVALRSAPVKGLVAVVVVIVFASYSTCSLLRIFI